MNREEILKKELGMHPQERRPASLGLIMLGKQNRQSVVDTMKEPLRQAIIDTGHRRGGILDKLRTLRAIWRIFIICQRYPVPTRENCSGINSLNLIDLRDWFMGHLLVRNLMFERSFNVFINLYEHAGEYTDFFDVLMERLVEVHNSGQWRARRKGRPLRRFWSE